MCKGWPKMITHTYITYICTYNILEDMCIGPPKMIKKKPHTCQTSLFIINYCCCDPEEVG